jgi:hypothetical protein
VPKRPRAAPTDNDSAASDAFTSGLRSACYTKPQVSSPGSISYPARRSPRPRIQSALAAEAQLLLDCLTHLLGAPRGALWSHTDRTVARLRAHATDRAGWSHCGPA